MATPRRLAIFRADAAAGLGGGHVTRCLTLADALVATGWSVGFAAVAGSTVVVPRLADQADLLEIDGACLDAGALARRWPAGCDILVVDHYELGAGFETPCRGWAKRIVVIDDLADRMHDCDLLVDATLGREAAHYAGLVASHALVLAGADYALLRSAFAARRDDAIAGRADRKRAARVLVTLGLTDLGGLTARVIRALLALPGAYAIDVVLGASAASYAELTAIAFHEPRVHLHRDPPDMAALMAAADLAIGAGGTTSWERCCLGLPTVLLVLADNQRLVASRLQAAGAVVCASDCSSAATIASGLVADGPRLATLAAAAAAIVDGRGTMRVLVTIRGLVAAPPGNGVKLRAATARDSALVWTWRNDPVSRANSRDDNPVPWADHDRWFKRSLDSAGRIMLIGLVDNEPAGIVRFDRLDARNYLASLNLAPERRGTGLGMKLLALACHVFAEWFPDATISAEIKEANIASKRIFEACGFAGAGHDEGYLLYQRPPERGDRHRLAPGENEQHKSA